MKLFFKKVNKLNKAFTLVETLVAIAIFTMSIVALMSVLANGISDTTYAKRKMTATYLAQEGIETIYKMRDDYVLYTGNTGLMWYDINGLNGFVNKLIRPTSKCNTTGCYFNDLNINSGVDVKACASATNCPLYYDSLSGKYSYFGTNKSGFDRIIKINVIDLNKEIQVTSTVYWTQGSGNYHVTFSENLFNWTP